jgi:hypothetical protein
VAGRANDTAAKGNSRGNNPTRLLPDRRLPVRGSAPAVACPRAALADLGGTKRGMLTLVLAVVGAMGGARGGTGTDGGWGRG